MQPQKQYLQELQTAIRAQVKQGVYMEDAIKNVGFSATEVSQLLSS
ncbi:hypothetical protein [Bathymodiolus platifrons methanotrophic gill symbiont]|nr:hypothetical protein [Bathymodiolus platifrons methanotrophic gill symbiont]